MSWAKFDDQYTDHPKIVYVGPLGLALHVAATCYCARYLTDGFVPSAMMNRLLCFDGINVDSNAVTTKLLTDKLVEVGLFELSDGGYMVHDYLKYNPSGAQVKAEREANAARQKEWQANHRDGKGKFTNNGVSNNISNGVSNGVSNIRPVPVPVPVPVPLIKDKDSEIENPISLDDNFPEQKKVVIGMDKKDKPQKEPKVKKNPSDPDYWKFLGKNQQSGIVFYNVSNVEPIGREYSKWNKGFNELEEAGITVDDIPMIVEKMRKERLTINAPQSLLAIGRDMKSRGLLHSAPMPHEKKSIKVTYSDGGTEEREV